MEGIVKGDAEKPEIPKGSLVTVTKTNHVVEIQYMQKMNFEATIKKLDKDRYMVIDTGEIKEFTHSENRGENHNSLRQTFKKLRYLINNNFVGRSNELHVILTYKENMTDTKKLYKDFKNFVERLRTRYKSISSIDYLGVAEPQGRGAWHMHVLARFNDVEKIYIPNKFDETTKQPVEAPMYETWGHGWVTIKSLKDVDNIGAYLSAYLTDLEFDAEKFSSGEYNLHEFLGKELEIKSVIHEGKDKKFIKGGRLHMYPSGMNLYRKSKGIVPPERERMFYSKAKKIVGSAQPHYSKAYHVEQQDFENTIIFEQYNMKR